MIVHRDIKTLNIFPKFSDSCSLRILNAILKHIGVIHIIGTVLYSAPEIYRALTFILTKRMFFSFSIVANEASKYLKLFENVKDIFF